MATIKWGAIGVDVRGSIGGTIFSKNANASYAKNFTKPTNPDTTGQQTVRGIFGTVSQLWKTLTDAERQSWIDAAANFPYTNKVGETSYYTGSQLFNKLNGQLLQGDPAAVIFTTAPSLLSLTSIFQMTTALSVASGGTLTVNNTTDLPVGQEVLVFATGPISNGVYRPKKNQFKRIGSYPTVGFGSIDGAAYTADLIAKTGPLVAGEVRWVRSETYAPATGQTLPGVMYKAVVTA